MKYLVVLILLIGCNYKIEKNKNIETTRPSQETLDNVSFKLLKDEVLNSKCIACHGNSGGVNLESFSSAINHLATIEKTTLQTKTMPKSPMTSLNERQLEILTAWIEAGGPEFSRGQHAPDEGGETDTLNFNFVKKKILDSKCLTCHVRGGEASGLPFETREDILNSKNIVVPNKPDQSLIYTITAPGARDMMPPYPMTPLNVEEREIIRKWILNGVP